LVELVLASTSRWRRDLLSAAGLTVRAVDPGVDEASIVGEDPVETARLRAAEKARRVAEKYPDAVVIGADQVIHIDGERLGKPKSASDHVAQLRRLRGRIHQLTTAVALADGDGIEVFHVDTEVRFRADLTDDEIAAYVASGEARGCAGGYMVERRGAWLVESLNGDWSNVVGLPVLHLIARLRARGFRLPGLGETP
jgi:septum formation protein